jgi:uncharacterized protein (DUF305 family)
MNKDKLLYGAIGMVVGIIVTSLFTNYVINGNPMAMSNMMGEQSSSMMSNNVDQHFIEQMIPHHEDAITMANIALDKAEHREIKDLSQNIIKSQTGEINKMESWYKDWFGKDVPNTTAEAGHSMGSEMMQGNMTDSNMDISSLESAQPFDKAFIEQMISHHQMAVMMAQMMERATVRPEMKDLAQDIIGAQNKEIEQMKNWNSQWYK